METHTHTLTLTHTHKPNSLLLSPLLFHSAKRAGPTPLSCHGKRVVTHIHTHTHLPSISHDNYIHPMQMKQIGTYLLIMNDQSKNTVFIFDVFYSKVIQIMKPYKALLRQITSSPVNHRHKKTF